MGLFRRRVVDEARSGYTIGQLGGLPAYFVSGTTGRVVTADDSMRTAAVWACVRVLAGSASTLPLDAYRGSGNDRRPVSPVPSLLAAPSALVPLDVWLFQIVWSMLADGSGWGRILDRDRAGYPTQIETLNPSKITERRLNDQGRPSVRVDGETHGLYPNGDIWHVPGLMVLPGSPFGASTVGYAAGTIDASIAAEQFGARFFTDGGHPSSIIYSDRDLDAEQAADIKTKYVAATQGREPAVFGSGLKHEQVQVDPNDSQFLDLLRFEVENVCRFFGVPPAMVFAASSGQNVTYANVSQADLHYLKHSLDPYLVRIENALTALLARPQYVKFNRNALLRADTLTRYQTYEIALRTKTKTVDEIRALEDEPPFGGDSAKPGIPGSGLPGGTNGNPP